MGAWLGGLATRGSRGWCRLLPLLTITKPAALGKGYVGQVAKYLLNMHRYIVLTQLNVAMVFVDLSKSLARIPRVQLWAITQEKVAA